MDRSRSPGPALRPICIGDDSPGPLSAVLPQEAHPSCRPLPSGASTCCQTPAAPSGVPEWTGAAARDRRSAPSASGMIRPAPFPPSCPRKPTRPAVFFPQALPPAAGHRIIGGRAGMDRSRSPGPALRPICIGDDSPGPLSAVLPQEAHPSCRPLPSGASTCCRASNHRGACRNGPEPQPGTGAPPHLHRG